MLSTFIDELLQPTTGTMSKNVPKYNHYTENGVLHFELNVAGYKKEDLEVLYDGKLLTVKTKKEYTVDAKEATRKLYDYYVYGVKLYPFLWQTAIPSYYIDSTAICDLEDGLLKISFVREKPELQAVNLLEASKETN